MSPFHTVLYKRKPGSRGTRAEDSVFTMALGRSIIMCSMLGSTTTTCFSSPPLASVGSPARRPVTFATPERSTRIANPQTTSLLRKFSAYICCWPFNLALIVLLSLNLSASCSMRIPRFPGCSRSVTSFDAGLLT